MIEKFNTNAKVENFKNMTGIAVRLIVIDPLTVVHFIKTDVESEKKTLFDV